MPVRFCLQQTPSPGAELALDEERSNYLCRVMRMRQGDLVHCFDGAGTAFTAHIQQADPRLATLRVAAVQPAVANEQPALGVALGLLKGQAMDRALQQATELGATHIWIFAGQRSNAKLAAADHNPKRRNNKMSHWHKVLVGAAEQSGRLYLPEFAQTTLEQLLADCAFEMLVLHPGQNTFPAQLTPVDRLLLIGPEGGWSDEELRLFNNKQLSRFSLGPWVLRAETAPAAALALTRQALANARP